MMFCLLDRAACSIWSFVRSLYQNHFDEDVDLSKIYRYLDRLNHTQQEKVQDISVRHTRELLGGNIGVMFYDVTTLYFEADREDDLHKTGFSKDNFSPGQWS